MRRTLLAAVALATVATLSPAPAPVRASTAGWCEAYCVTIKLACDASIGRWYKEGCAALKAGCDAGCRADGGGF